MKVFRSNQILSFVKTYCMPLLEPNQHIIINNTPYKSYPYPCEGLDLRLDKRIRYQKELSIIDRGECVQDLYVASGVYRYTENPNTGLATRKETNQEAFFIVCCDDVGSLVEIARLKALELTPTWVVETSPGNFQWVYVIYPHKDLGEAKEFLIQLVDQGLTDPGGRTVNKLVRLPSGRNIKTRKDNFTPKYMDPEHGGFFRVRLRTAANVKYDFWDLAAGLQLDIKRIKSESHKQLSTVDSTTAFAHWNPHDSRESDAIVEALIAGEYCTQMDVEDAKERADGFIKLRRCLWEHNSGQDGVGHAAFSPVGFGGKYMGSHQFDCKHKTCIQAGRKASDVAEKLIELGLLNPRKVEKLTDSAQGRLKDLLEFMVLANNGLIYDLRKPYHPMSLAAFSAKYRPWTIPAGKKDMSIATAWLNDRAKKVVDGLKFHPGENVLFEKMGVSYLNIYRPVKISPRPCSEETQRLLQWLFDMICPPDENGQQTQDDFIDFMAMKLRDPGWRPQYCFVSLSEFEGTGRGTIDRIMSMLLGPKSVRQVQTSDFFDSQFNDYLMSSWLACSEFYLDKKSKRHSVHEMVSKLNQIITSPTLDINTKYGLKGDQEIFCAVFLQTNYATGLQIRDESRRYYIMGSNRNPVHPKYSAENQANYAKIHELLDKDASGQEGVLGEIYTLLMDRVIDQKKFNARPPCTPFMSSVIQRNLSDLERAMQDVIESDLIWPSKVLSAYLRERTGEIVDMRTSAAVRNAVRRAEWQTAGKFRPYLPTVNGRQVGCFAPRGIMAGDRETIRAKITALQAVLAPYPVSSSVLSTVLQRVS